MSDADRTLRVLFAHPTFEKSRVNRRLVAAACETPGPAFHDPYECPPNSDIDVACEPPRAAYGIGASAPDEET